MNSTLSSCDVVLQNYNSSNIQCTSIKFLISVWIGESMNPKWLCLCQVFLNKRHNFEQQQCLPYSSKLSKNRVTMRFSSSGVRRIDSFSMLLNPLKKQVAVVVEHRDNIPTSEITISQQQTYLNATEVNVHYACDTCMQRVFIHFKRVTQHQLKPHKYGNADRTRPCVYNNNQEGLWFHIAKTRLCNSRHLPGTSQLVARCSRIASQGPDVRPTNQGYRRQMDATCRLETEVYRKNVDTTVEGKRDAVSAQTGERQQFNRIRKKEMYRLIKYRVDSTYLKDKNPKIARISKIFSQV
ncbi:hypothetical protein WN51_11435 [Melipona quadrifasciata]|uniref:Uncharacterized protein n=1 Tax=Melipona quadrifasciata TaxID=166423 RepID=A0A0N0U7J5_9HYME|nr:hypothetical protein WN51_11435 [Melipona quadrifasciata]